MGKKVDLTGQRFGKLVVIRDVGRKNGMVLWECLCDCGKHTNVVSNNLTRGNTKSCGCMTTKIDLTGQRFGKLEVIEAVTDNKNKKVWVCKCDCGNYKNYNTGRLSSGNAKSCGCLVGGKVNLNNHRFGRLTAVEETNERCGGKVVWECLCDCGKTTYASSDNLRRGITKSCGCLAAEMVGTNSPSYKSDIPDQERCKFRYELCGGNSIKWSKQIMERDNYTCQTCGDNKGGNLNAHHLNAWNAFPEERFDLDNGVTLCVDCHKEFHKMYGRGDNTREQFDEYAASKTLVLN